MTIFGTKSPLDRFGGKKPKLVKRAKPGRLMKLANKLGPLLKVKYELDKVYSNGYFENYYPDADKLLKGSLHEKAMEAWAHADGLGSTDMKTAKSCEHEEHSENQGLNITINIEK